MEIILLKTPISIEASLKNIEYTYFPFLDNFNNKLIILDNRHNEWSTETISRLSFDNKILIISNKKFNETNHIKFLFFDDPIEKNIEQFSNSLMSKIAWSIDANENFDEDFYLNEYPDLSQYWLPWAKENGYSERKRLFHHYYLYGRKEGRLCSQEEKDIIDEKIKKHSVKLNELVDEEMNLDSICFFKNKLECIFLNMTSKEGAEYNNFLERLVQNTNKNFSKNIDFKVIINNAELIPNLVEIKKLFKKVELINLNLTKEEDIYISPKNEKVYFGKNKKEAPIYGTKSGPNLMFLKTMRILKSYNSCLMLETDCFFSKDWLEKMISYVDSANGFLISGSTYDGSIFTKSNSANLNHLNGVALYATGNNLFQFIIEHFEEFLKSYVSVMPNIAYDFGIKVFIDKNIDSSSNHSFWKFINRNYVVNKYIFNYSPPKDASFNEKEIMEIYNYAILHKKPLINV